MNTYKDFVNVHGITLDPRGVKMYIDWLLACENDTQARKIGEAMQAAIDNYLEEIKVDINNKYGVKNYCDNLNYEGEAKRLLKAAVDDLNNIGSCKTCVKFDGICRGCRTDYKWVHADEALALIGEDGEQNES